MKADGMVTLETLNDTQSATPENVFLDPPATDGPLQHVEHRRRKRRRVNKPKLHITSGELNQTTEYRMCIILYMYALITHENNLYL